MKRLITSTLLLAAMLLSTKGFAQTDTLTVTLAEEAVDTLKTIVAEGLEEALEPLAEEAGELCDEAMEPLQQSPCCGPLKKDRMLFNHVALGVSVGLDGIGGHVALPIGRHFIVRGGYTFLPKLEKTPRELSDLPLIGSAIPVDDMQFKLNEGSQNERTIDAADVPLGLSLNTFGPHLLFDLYPGKKSGFHFTLGAVMTAETLLAGTIDLSGQLTPDEYATIGISYKDVEDVTTDEEGILHLDLRAQKIRPYVGIGFGRPLNMRHRVSVNFDLGAVYVGEMGLYSYDYAQPAGIGRKDVQITSAKLQNEDEGKIDDVLSKIPFFPMMKLSINVRLF